MTTVIYDLESTGTDTRFDQPTQVAAVVLDDDLNEIGSFNTRARRLPGIVPSPGAIAVTGVSGPALDDEPKSLYDAMLEFRRFVATQGKTEVLGYNSIKFDDEMVRATNRRNLLPMFQLSSEGNVRGDVMGMAIAFGNLRPDIFTVPIREKTGREAWKLTDIANANGAPFDPDTAHDALADVRATAAVYRRMRELDPDAFDLLRKQMDPKFTQGLMEQEPLLILASQTFGRSKVMPVMPLVADPDRPNSRLVLDLAAISDKRLEKLFDMDPEALQRELTKSGHPLRLVKANAQPSMLTPDLVADQVMAELPDRATLEARIARVQEALETHPTFKANLQAMVVASRPADPAMPHPEQRLYAGWPTEGDRNLMQWFHKAKWEDRHEALGQFADPDLTEFAREILYARDPALLPAAARAEEEAKIRQRLDAPAGQGGPRSLADAARDFEIYVQKNPEKMAAATEALDWIRDRFRADRPLANGPAATAATAAAAAPAVDAAAPAAPAAAKSRGGRPRSDFSWKL